MTQLDLLDLLESTPSILDRLAGFYFGPRHLPDLLAARTDPKAGARLKREVQRVQGGHAGTDTDGVWWSCQLHGERIEVRHPSTTFRDEPDSVHTLTEVMRRAHALLTVGREREIRDAHARELADQARREARFDELARYWPDGSPVMWEMRHDTAWERQGDRRPGVRCWVCGVVEPSDTMLGLNHARGGWNVDDGGRCGRQILLGSQLASARQRGDHAAVARAVSAGAS